MRDIQVLKFSNDSRLLVDLEHVVAIERTDTEHDLILYTRGNHCFRVSLGSADEAMGVIERWTNR